MGTRLSVSRWLLAVASAVALAIALFDYFWPNNGIHGTAGALLVVASTAVALVLSIVLAVGTRMAYWVMVLVRTLILIDLVGTAVAAWLLNAWWLLALVVLAVIGWILQLAPATRARHVHAPAAAALLIVAGIGALALTNSLRAQSGANTDEQTTGSDETLPASPQYTGWYTFNGDLMDQKYAALDQITPANVGRLVKAWEVHTGDVSDGKGKIPPSDWSATPLFVNDTVYVSTPFYRVFALAPDTGKVRWVYDSHAELKALTQPDLKTRGVAYWQAATAAAARPCQKIVYLGTMDAKLHAIDADTGQPCDGFANHGVLDLNQWNTTNAKWPLSVLQPPTVYNDTLFIGWAGKDWEDTQAPPGTVFAVDAQTGSLKWTFHALPDDVAPKTGTANVWASMSVDPQHGILYLPISSPSPNFWGGNRTQPIPMATSMTALDAATGKVLWTRQIVHHDIWDYDTNAAPTLVDLHKDGKTIPALVQTSKMGFLFVLNRLTGEPIYPIEERSVPGSDVPGERASPTQPYPAKPEPTVADRLPGIFWLADWASFGECSNTFHKLRYDGRYTPPSVQGSIAYPSTAGGIEWGGGAVDPRTGVYVVNSSAVAQIYRLVPRDKYANITRNGTPDGYHAQQGSPYGFYLKNFINRWGMPCWAPPYGTISAYDLNSGDLLWRRPFGEVQKWGFYMPESWGSVTIGGPVITRSGLVLVGGSMDARVRAIDLKTGDVLWKALVDAPAVANPATYLYKGRQYVVFVAGGNAILKPQSSDQVVAFALPEQTS